ncbi:uncharacterized protein LOC117171160 [Belonocnema kinseyi]|uniref:uncharacterized protein LOC117171160 n=1 Tax=Belonocnema kinseyi TaxID=2817044 RepID=UPI00143D1442|nr:uncharacterized protein LOC117171160 [Belonocnema kinseyi]
MESRVDEIRNLAGRVGLRSQVQADKEDPELTSDEKERNSINQNREPSRPTEITSHPCGSRLYVNPKIQEPINQNNEVPNNIVRPTPSANPAIQDPSVYNREAPNRPIGAMPHANPQNVGPVYQNREVFSHPVRPMLPINFQHDGTI